MGCMDCNGSARVRIAEFLFLSEGERLWGSLKRKRIHRIIPPSKVKSNTLFLYAVSAQERQSGLGDMETTISYRAVDPAQNFEFF